MMKEKLYVIVYKLKIQLKYFPKLEVTVNDRNGYTDDLISGKINFSTTWHSHDTSITHYKNRVTAGYIKGKECTGSIRKIKNTPAGLSRAIAGAGGVWRCPLCCFGCAAPYRAARAKGRRRRRRRRRCPRALRRPLARVPCSRSWPARKARLCTGRGSCGCHRGATAPPRARR